MTSRPPESLPTHSLPNETLPNETLLSGHPGAVSPSPFPYLCRVPALAPDYYAELSASFPASETILRGRVDTAGNMTARLPHMHVTGNLAIPAIWRDFFDLHVSARFWGDIVAVFGSHFRQIFPNLETKLGGPLGAWRVLPRGADSDAEVKLDCQFVINTPGEETVSVKTAHVDAATTIFSALLYLRDPADDSRGGELELFRWKRPPRFFGPRLTLPRDVAHVTTIPYRANAFCCFINQPQAVHGVTPRHDVRLPRRYINLIATVPTEAFALPKLGKLTRFLCQREISTQTMRSLGGDRY